MKKKFMEGFANLMEQDLEGAELLLAANDMVDRLQKMAEDVASMQVEELMPLVDAMRDQFGTDQADAFNSSVEAALQGALDTIRSTHDQVDTAIKVLSGEEVSNDMGDIPAPTDMDSTELDAEDDTINMDGDDSASGPEDEPIGRETKDESFESVKTSLFNALQEGKLGTGMLRKAAKGLK